MQKLKIENYSDEEDDHIFINYTLVNQNVARLGSTLAKIVDNRASPIIANPEKYNVTISRFGIPTSDIPLFVYPIGNVPGTSLNYFVVTLFYGGVNYQATAVPVDYSYLPNDLYIYYVQQFLDSLNNAFAVAWGALNTANPGVVASAPFYIYNQSTSLISLICLPTYVSSGVQIWISSEINNRISGITSFFNGHYNTDYHDFMYIVKDFGNNEYIYAGGPFLSFTQEGIQLGNMTDIQGIVFISNLPSQSENTGISITTDATGGYLSPSNSNLQILLDFEPIQGSSLLTTISAQRFQYQPSLYRLVPLIGTVPISSINFQIFYQNNTGALMPITIGPSTSMNVKLLFLKKGLSS